MHARLCEEKEKCQEPLKVNFLGIRSLLNVEAAGSGAMRTTMVRREESLSQWHPGIFLSRISLWGRRGGEEAKALREAPPAQFLKYFVPGYVLRT